MKTFPLRLILLPAALVLALRMVAKAHPQSSLATFFHTLDHSTGARLLFCVLFAVLLLAAWFGMKWWQQRRSQ